MSGCSLEIISTRAPPPRIDAELGRVQQTLHRAVDHQPRRRQRGDDCGVAGDRLRSAGGADRHGVLRRRRRHDDIEDTTTERLGGQPRCLDEQRTALRFAEHRHDLAVDQPATREVRSERLDVSPLGHRSALRVAARSHLFASRSIDVVGRFDVEQMAGVRDHHEPGVRDQIGERERVGDRSLLSRARRPRTTSAHVIVGSSARLSWVTRQSIDRAQCAHRTHEPSPRAARPARPDEMCGPAIAVEHVAGEVGRLATGIERRQPCGAPLVGLRAVEPERRTGRQQCQAEQPRRVPRGDVLGDHPAERDAGKVRLRRTEHIDEVDDGIGERGEVTATVERGRCAVAGHVPRDDTAAVRKTVQLRLPRQPAAAEAVQQHQHRNQHGPVAADSRQAKRSPSTSVGVLTSPSLPCSEIFVNGVDIVATGHPESTP